MGLLATFLSGESRASLENPNTPLSDFSDFDFAGSGGGISDSGIPINRQTVLTYDAFWRGVNLISNDVAKAKPDVFERVDNGKERDTDHPAYRLLRQKVNPEMNSFQFFLVMTGHVKMSGNAYAWINRNGGASPTELIVLDPQKVTPVRANGTLSYMVEVHTNTPDGSSFFPMTKIESDDMIHFKGLGWDGIQGYSVLRFGANSFGKALGVERFSTAYFANNAAAGVVLETPNKLSDKARAALKDGWDKMHQGMDNIHRTAVLEEGLQANSFDINARDAMLIESHNVSVWQVANWLGMPLHLLGHPGQSGYNSLESENQAYVGQTIDALFAMMEAELEDKLLTEDEKKADSHIIEFNRAALVRADLKTKADFYMKALGGRAWMLPNQVRAIENLNTLSPEEVAELPGAFTSPFAEEPAEPSDEDTEAVDDRDGLATAHNAILRGTFRRILGRLTKQAQHKAKKPEAYRGWVEALHEQHVAVADELQPTVTAMLVGGKGDPETESMRMAVEFTDMLQLRLAGLYEDRITDDHLISRVKREIELMITGYETK